MARVELPLEENRRLPEDFVGLFHVLDLERFSRGELLTGGLARSRESPGA